MKTFLDFYLAGERESVWSDLTARGAMVREEPLFSDAWAVAKETMRRVRANIELLVPRLLKLGYQFEFPFDKEGPAGLCVFRPPPADVQHQIAALESQAGPLPLSLRAFYEVVGTVSFIGKESEGEALPSIASIGSAEDPLTVYSVEVAQWDYKNWQLDYAADGWPFRIDIAPDYLRKNNVSGGPTYKMLIPNSHMDGLLLNEWHNTSFVNYLRICFRWGGFPGLERSMIQPEDDLAFLRKGLLSI